MATNGWTWRRRATWVLLSLMACTGLGGQPVSARRPATGQLKVFERSFEAGLGRTIQVENTSGTTKVEVWGEDLIHIMAARPDGRWVDERDIKIVATPSQFTVRCIPKMGGINLKLYIPAECHVRLLSHSGTIELIGPVASATAETDSGDIAVEVPRWFDADVELHSANGTATSHLSLARYEEKSSRAIKGRLGRGGRAIVVRSAGGHVALKSLRSSVAIVEPAPTPSVAVADDTIPSQPTRFPPPDDRPADRPLTPIFGGGTQSQDESSATYGGVGGIGRRQQRIGDDTTMSGGIGVRIIPPPGSRSIPSGTGMPSGAGGLPPAGGDNRGSTGDMPNHDAGQFSAADEALANLPRRDPLRTTPDGRPTLRRRALDIPVDEADETGVDADTIRLNARLVNLNVIATTQDGRAVTNLTAEDFAIFDEETKQEIAHFKPTNTPFNLVLLLDLSGSTREKIEAIRKGAWRFVELTSPQDRVAIVTFTRSVHVLCRPTNDRALLKQRIAEMRATDGGTAYYEAMWFTLTEVLAPFQDERNAVVVMTDGVDNSISAAYPAPSRVSFRQMLEAILESGTLVYPIYLDTEEENFRNHWGETAEVYALARTQLQQVADASGAVLYVAARVEDLAGVYQKVIAELRTVYGLAYYPTQVEHSSRWRRVKVTARRPGVIIRTRRGYYDR
ncbi:VWA domain-containing protein [Chloracidobacterium sp. MS 40/45]|uniref:VWA domain-containing protein n=1 Tax=Chloracidobacterium aggregatum TaxID=2851959 RepID=UPI001B8CAF86|nr:VWA domain-containing protein [Chloracidobacterium aggregatum]QUV99145.1 VWA domain-containing protein [Chloracidobacterium sp. MS 40/45]